jgi:hypothetical protein
MKKWNKSDLKELRKMKIEPRKFAYPLGWKWNQKKKKGNENEKKMSDM